MKLLRKSVLAVVAALALCVATATPAAADSGDSIYQFWPDRLAHASFSSHGEIFTVHDDEADGRAAIVWWSVGSQSGQCVNSGGAGSSKTCDLSFAEGRTIKWQLSVQGWANPSCCTAIVGVMKTDQT